MSEPKIITNAAYNGLNTIATKTKMDCWFSIKSTEASGDYVVDLEEGRRVGWKQALSDLQDGIVDPLEELLPNEEERNAVNDLFAEYGLPRLSMRRIK